MRRVASVVMLGLTATLLAAYDSGARAARDLPVVVPNDNHVAAGALHDGVLHLSLVARMARWYPEADGGPFVDAVVLGEEGKAPQVPAPLLRVPVGTTIEASIRNESDSTLWVFGLVTHPAATMHDSLAVPAHDTRRVRFAAGAPGTYMYYARPGIVNHDLREREQASGAFIVDSAGARMNDRVLVLNIWGETIDSLNYRNALAINGKAWPYTERISATVGDSVRWRVVNGTNRPHPMHLHGFYFRIDAEGTGFTDTTFAPARRRLAVTEHMLPASTMSIVWSPDRPGNWLFHCHLAFHAVPEAARLDNPQLAGHAGHFGGAMQHMAGLVLGISVQPSAGWRAAARPSPRLLHLYVDEGARRHLAPRTLGYVIGGTGVPAPDSIVTPGSVLVLEEGQPTDITVVNRLPEATAVHWHGVELESWSDGVTGWSGGGTTTAPPIAPGDSFVAHLTLPRAGTFIYHTHLDDLEQLSSGLYGAIVVLPRGVRYDPARDHVYVASWDSPADPPPHWLVNGDSTAADMTVPRGVTQRLRIVNIGLAGMVAIAIRRDTSLVQWKHVATDGADLPVAVAVSGPSLQRVTVGQTADMEWTPADTGAYRLVVNFQGRPVFRQRVIVR